MGFRSTFVTDDRSWEWPEWFREKHPGVHFPDHDGPISSRREGKAYGVWGDEFIGDVQKCLIEKMEKEQDEDPCLVLLFLHECGGVTRYHIKPYSLVISEPQFWKETGEVTHCYCDDCSPTRGDLDKPEDYAATIEGHKRRADSAVRAYDSLRGDFAAAVNAKIIEFVESWKKEATASAGKSKDIK